MSLKKRCCSCREIKDLGQFKSRKGDDPVLTSCPICIDCQKKKRKKRSEKRKRNAPVTPQELLKQYLVRPLEEATEAEKVFANALDRNGIYYEFSYP